MWIHIPVGYLYCIGNARTDWCYRRKPSWAQRPRDRLPARTGHRRQLFDQRDAYRGARRAITTSGRSSLEIGLGLAERAADFMKSEDHWRGADEKHGRAANCASRARS